MDRFIVQLAEFNVIFLRTEQTAKIYNSERIREQKATPWKLFGQMLSNSAPWF